MIFQEIRKFIFRKSFFILWLAVITFGLSRLFAIFPAIAETVYSQGLYPFFASVLSFFSNWFSFSLDDMFYSLLVILIPILIVLLILKKIRIKEFAKLLGNILAALFILFYWLWGFNYFRQDLNTRLNIQEVTPNKDALLSTLEELVKATNESYRCIDSTELKTIDESIEASYEKHACFLRIPYPAGSRRAKNITYGKFFAKATISGYYGPFFNEVHVNSYVLPVEYPLVLAHEKAHQFGITSEAEANFYAWLVCSQSDDKRLKYSANLFILRYFIYEASRLEESKEILKYLSEDVRNDYSKIRKHWMALQNKNIIKVASKVNDAYLKANRVEKGIEDYSGVVKFVMDYRAL